MNLECIYYLLVLLKKKGEFNIHSVSIWSSYMHFHIIISQRFVQTLKSLFTNSGEEAHGCIDNGSFIVTELGGNLASKSVKIQKII